jgi:hypothetical protein
MAVSEKVHMLHSTPASPGLAGDPGRCAAYFVTRTPKDLGFRGPRAAYEKYASFLSICAPCL